MIRNKIFILTCFILIASCKNRYNTEDIDFEVVSPVEQNMYYDDLYIIFAVNKPIDAIQWSSSINGKLGCGSQISIRLSAGKHTIKAINGNCIKTLTITVLPRFNENTAKTKFRILHTPSDYMFKSNGKKAYIAALNGTAEEFFIKKDISGNDTMRSINPHISNSLKLFRCTEKICFRPLVIPKRHTILNRTLKNEDEKYFFVVNTYCQTENPHRILFKKHYTSSTLDVWIPKDIPVDLQAINTCINEVESIILIRITEIFGKPADIDENKKITILFSHTINDEKKALGFFNPVDFFQNNNDNTVDFYNPASNEADIIYAAIPSMDSASNYFYKAISATIGHELTHAVTFTEKTYSRVKAGKIDMPRMDIFLDEGLSHLSENLIGYGISGGNINFFNKFLSNTIGYSFCKKNAFGQEDSAGQRGAMTLFLSWCFWEKGGMSWQPDNTIHVIDNGGITFLKKLISSEYTGWDAIGNAFGTATDNVFLQMLDFIRSFSTANKDFPYTHKVDPFTGEAVEFLPYMGKIQCHNTEFFIDAPQPQIKDNKKINIFLPYSFVFVDNDFLDNTNQLTHIKFYAKKLNGVLLFCLTE